MAMTVASLAVTDGPYGRIAMGNRSLHDDQEGFVAAAAREFVTVFADR